MVNPLRPRLLSLFFVLLLAGSAAIQAVDQTPLQAFQRAILNGNEVAARTALRRVKDLDTPTRAVLQAASMPVAQRAMAMQQIARLYPKHAMADTAIVAGCAALMSSQGLGLSVPGMDQPKRARELPKAFVLVDLIKGFRQQITDRRKAKGDTESLDEAEWMLRTLSVTEVVESPRRIAVGGTLPIPSPLKEDMRLRFHPFDLDRELVRVWRRPTTQSAVEAFTLKKETFGQSIAAPGPGVYVVELTAADTGWTRLERLIVSDLTLVAQSWPGLLAVMASTETGAAGAKAASGVELTLVMHLKDSKSKTLKTKTDATGLATFALPGNTSRLVLDGRLGKHVARISPSSPQRRKLRSGSWKTHLVVDRPIYRPGETVQGRVLLRREEPRVGQLVDGPTTSDTTTSTFVTNVVKNRAVEVCFWRGSKQEVILRGTTDDHGVLPFQMKLARSAPLRLAYVHVVVPGGLGNKDAVMRQRSPFRVREFRRPVILCDAHGPTKATRTEPFEVTLSCRYAAGAPGSGLRADVTARCNGLIHRTSVILDKDGKARVPVNVHELPLPDSRISVSVSASFHSPDGQRISARSYTSIEAKKTPEDTDKKPRTAQRFGLERVGPAKRAGEPLVIEITGTPGERVLLTTVRDIPTGTRIVHLDSTGKTTLSLATTKDDFPGLQLIASLHSRRPRAPILSGSYWGQFHDEVEELSDWDWHQDQNAESHTFQLQPPASGLAIEFDKKDIYRPGSTAEMKLRVTRDGKPAQTTVAVTIVDETIYSLAADRNADPASALRPKWLQLMRTQVSATRQRCSPWHIIGRLMRRGMMESPEEEEELFESGEWNTAIGLGGGAGGRYGGRRGGSAITLRTRKRFSPTAFFVGNLVTDADGRVRFQFDFPDDLTKWRITAIAVDDSFYGAKAVAATETRLPVSVTPILPRILRAGDEVRIGVTANKEGDGRASGTVELVSGSRAVHVDGPTSRDVTVDGVQPRRIDFSLRASHAGSSKMTATATLGEIGDRAELPLPVLSDTVVRPVVVSKLIENKGEISLPDKPDLTRRRVLRLLGNRDALLREASEYLSGYPYGCVEQVLSRLTPLFIAARTTRLANGGDGAFLTEQQGLRLEVGMVALRGHLVSANDGFRWWHGDSTDKRMTALALNSLMIAREAGIDPERYGVVVNCGSRHLTSGSKAIAKSKGELGKVLDKDKPNPHDAELAVALLRYDPTVAIHRQAVRALLHFDQARSAGLLARMGLALHRAGDRASAEIALKRILLGDRVAQDKSSRGMRFPMDRTAARTAHLLELILRVDPKHEARARTVGSLLALQRDGRFGSTYSTASAVHALALDAELSGHKPNDAPFTVTVNVGLTNRVLTLSKDNHFVAEWKTSASEAFKITVAETRQVHALLRGGVEKRGSTHPGWSEPIRVVRRLYRISYDAAGKPTRHEIGAGEVPRGKVVELVIDVSCAEAASYLVVDCPLPAGFEVLGRPHGFEVRDDRVVKLIRSLRSNRPVEIRVTMIAAHEGKVAWPPAVVQAMYAPEMNGACKGARLSIIAPQAGGNSSATTRALLTSAYYDARLATAVKMVREGTETKPTYDALRALNALFFASGSRAVLPLAPALIRRHARSARLMNQLFHMVSRLPEAKRAREKSLEGAASELGFLMLAYTGKRPSDGDAWLRALQPMLQDDTFGGLSLADRRPLVLQQFKNLVSRPWRKTVQRLATKNMLLHCDSTEVAEELLAWKTVLRAAVSMLHSQPFFGATATKVPMDWLDPFEVEFGAAPSANFEFALQQMDDIRWRLVGPLLDHRPTRNVGWIYSLHHTLDRDRLFRAYDRVLAASLASGDETSAQEVLRHVPTELRMKLGHHYTAALNHERGKVRWTAFTNMPDALRTQLPEAVLRSVFAHSSGRVSYLRPLGDRGVRIVRQWLLDGRSFLEPGQTCIFLAEHLKGLPLTALARLADTTTTRLLISALAQGKFPIAQLQMQMHDNSYGPWRICLVTELARRGAKEVLIDKTDPLRPTYNLLLGAWRGEVAQTLEVVRRLKENDKKRFGPRSGRRHAMPAYLANAFARSITARMQPQEFLSWGLVLDDATTKKTLASFGLREWRFLLTQANGNYKQIVKNVPKRIERTLLPELLQLAISRTDARNLALDRILAAKTGEEFLRSQLEERLIRDDLRQSVANRIFRFSGLVVTYPTDAGEIRRWKPSDTGSLATRIRKHGFSDSLSAKERTLVRTLLRRRGILPASQ